ncbi:MAG: rod shape-determining protein RodA [Legionellales bacterium RIFCSPHIGHO2_12_FULL_37_14]|nr:MAG: rod shape-determining protein RodA [Legionellales bacterium RIFCSPHIGHO2_12_FULL_37_14]
MKNKPIYKITNLSLHLDYQLLSLLFILSALGLGILYSASQSHPAIFLKQSIHLVLAFFALLFFSSIPPHKYKNASPYIYCFGLLLLITVMVIGKVGKGAQRWLDLGIMRFQPSEIMKLAVPMMSAWYFANQKGRLNFNNLAIGALIIFIPSLLIAKQPDLGTAISVAIGGLCVIFIAGVNINIMLGISFMGLALLPFLWHMLHDYQKQRIYTLLNPENDPLGSGYHIIQSKIAIGSGGLFGKGWLKGSQAHLNFLPEHATDFIFAVNGEEFGFIGSIVLIMLIFLITLRGLNIAADAQTNYTRLLAASLIMSFFFAAFINLGMVMGILPVVGIPLPLVSYGGSALITFLATFGVLMSISTHRILFTQKL